MPNAPGHRFGSCPQCPGFGGEPLTIVGATLCTRLQDSGERVCKRPELGLQGVGAFAGRKMIEAAPVDRRVPPRGYHFTDPDRPCWPHRARYVAFAQRGLRVEGALRYHGAASGSSVKHRSPWRSLAHQVLPELGVAHGDGLDSFGPADVVAERLARGSQDS